MADLLALSGTAQARLIRDGKVSAAELVDAHLKRIEEVNPRLKAVVEVLEEPARRAASSVGPRRSAKMTHLCSVRMTHTKNTICPRAREEALDIIHAEGVRSDLPASAPEARNAFSYGNGSPEPRKP